MRTTTILIGYPETDASGNPRGTPSIVSGPPADEKQRQAQAKLFSDAKTLHQFPTGIHYLAFCNCSYDSVAAFISDDVASVIDGTNKDRAEAEASALEKSSAVQKKIDARNAAQSALSKAAVKWNAKREAVGTAERYLADAQSNFNHGKTDSLKSKLESAQKKLEESKTAEKSAKDEYESSKSARVEIDNPTK
jgi:hypothetical protein